ncbi:hypothetical protein MMC29_000859 [Sticta canariensis]|nr:hypothetical protein [Sticta canariensis]
MEESQADFKIPDIFELDLEDNKSIANTPIETFDALEPMLNELNDLLDAAHERPDNQLVSEEDTRKLYVKYPFLEFVKREPGLGEPYSELEARLRVWDLARSQLGYEASPKERQATKLFWDFAHQYEADKFNFLPQRRRETWREDLVLQHYGWDQLWIFTQNLKPKELSLIQEYDLDQLEQLVASEIKDLLVSQDVLTIRTVLEESDLFEAVQYFVNLKDIVISKVEERISNGDWQAPGPNRFTFNGPQA